MKASKQVMIALAIVLSWSHAMGKIDVEAVKKLIPPLEKEPWMTTKGCRAFLHDYENGTLYLVVDFFAPGEVHPEKLYGKEVGTIEFAAPHLEKPVIKEGKTFDQHVETSKNPDGSTTLFFDTYREHFDTGGYFVRRRATVRIGADGKLLGFEFERFRSHRRFIIFGAFKDFELETRLACGEGMRTS
ncbi:MAG: hypothetical protein V4760_01180 [Bdellovibrionota bacterium]